MIVYHGKVLAYFYVSYKILLEYYIALHSFSHAWCGPSLTERFAYTTCKNHLYLKRTYSIPNTRCFVMREPFIYVQNFFFAFCNGKENRRHAFQYVWMKKSQSFSYENSSTCNVVSRNIASRGNSRGRNATKQYLSCKSNALHSV